MNESLEELIFQLVKEHDENLVTQLRKSFKEYLLKKMEVIKAEKTEKHLWHLHREVFPEDFE